MPQHITPHACVTVTVLKVLVLPASSMDGAPAAQTHAPGSLAACMLRLQLLQLLLQILQAAIQPLLLCYG